MLDRQQDVNKLVCICGVTKQNKLNFVDSPTYTIFFEMKDKDLNL